MRMSVDGVVTGRRCCCGGAGGCGGGERPPWSWVAGVSITSGSTQRTQSS
jgi:hypothetical protein